MSYRIKTVAQLTGIPRNTLVAWERRYDLLELRRSDSGYRIYEDSDVAYLRELKGLVDGGVAISEAISRTARPGQAPPVTVPPPPAVTPVQTDLVASLVHALVGFNGSAALPIMRRVDQMSFSDAIREVWQPLLFEVGRRWELGEISVAQEHFASGVARAALAAMLRSLGPARPGAVEVVCACLPQEHHDLPLLAASVELSLAGWHVIWLGADVPLADLCALVATRAPDLVCLSAIDSHPPEVVLAAGRTVLGSAPRGTTVALGGPATAGLRAKEGPRLWVCATPAELITRWEERAARPLTPPSPNTLEQS